MTELESLREIAKAFIFIVDHAERIDLYDGGPNSYAQMPQHKSDWAWRQLDLARELVPQEQRMK